jgi:hypothetical protein
MRKLEDFGGYAKTQRSLENKTEIKTPKRQDGLLEKLGGDNFDDFQIEFSQTENELAQKEKVVALQKFNEKYAARLQSRIINLPEDQKKEFDAVFGFLEALRIYQFSENPDKASLNSYIESLSAGELKVVIRQLSDLSVYRKNFQTDDILMIFEQLANHGLGIDINSFWNYGDQKIDLIDADINEKTLQAVLEFFISGKLSSAELMNQGNRLMQYLFRDRGFEHNPKDFLVLINNLMSYPPIKPIFVELVIPYWFTFCEALEGECKNTDFEDSDKANIRNMAQLQDVAANSYVQIMESGMQPNDDYEDFLLEYIEKCGNVDDYFMKIKHTLAVGSILNSTNEQVASIESQGYDPRENLIGKAQERFNFFEKKDEVASSKKQLGELNLQKKEIEGEIFYNHNIAPGISGYFNQNYDLVKVMNDGKIIEFGNFLELNYKGTLDEKYFLDILQFQNIEAKIKIRNDFDVDLDALSLRMQNQFLNFIKHRESSDISSIINIANKFGEHKMNFLKSFLSLEFDENNGSRIISIGEKLPGESAKLVFEKIAQLVDLVEKENAELAKIIFKDSEKDLPDNLQAELLRKAHQIILRFSTELESGGQASEEKIQKLLADLEKSRIDIDIMASLLIAMKKAGEGQNVSEIRGVEMVSISGEELKKDRELEVKLEEMYRASNSQKSKKDLERLLSDFERHKQCDPRFHLVYFDKNDKDQPKKSLENLVGFMRSSSFDGKRELPEGERYLGATNIDPILQKFYFGENFLREIVEKELLSGAKKLIAHVPENGPSHKITKLLGFETVAEEGDYRDDAGNVTAKRLRVELVKS